MSHTNNNPDLHYQFPSTSVVEGIEQLTMEPIQSSESTTRIYEMNAPGSDVNSVASSHVYEGLDHSYSSTDMLVNPMGKYPKPPPPFFDQQCFIEWRDITYPSKSANPILKNVFGFAAPGKVTAICGPVGEYYS